MKSYIQILGTYTSDTTPSIVVHFDSQRYLFNCGEGTQRLLSSHKIRMGKLRNIFITHMDWRHTGGIPGLILTMSGSIQDSIQAQQSDQTSQGATATMSRKGFRFFGPPNTTHFMASFRHFVSRPEFPLSTFEFGVEGHEYEDENVKILAVPIRRDDDFRVIDESHLDAVRKNKEVVSRLFASRDEDANATKEVDSEASEHVHSREDSACRPIPVVEGELPKTYPDDSALCYILQGHDLIGKFDNKKAKELGVPNGSIRGNLMKGEEITLNDGRIIKPQDVIGPPQPGKIILILHLPSKHYIKSLANSHIKSLLDKRAEVSSIVHILDDEELLFNEEYNSFVQQFGTKVEHILLAKNTNRDYPQFTAASNQQTNLHRIDKELFPIMYHQSKKDFKEKIESVRKKARFNFECGNLLLRYDVTPKSFLNHEEAKPAEAKFRLYSGDRKAEMISQNPRADCRVLFLGTGSMLPSKYRNVSGIYVNFPKGAAILDVGEGSYGQLARIFGPDMIKNALSQLKCIVVSHLHADHHMGFLRVLLEWSKATEKKESILHIIAPKGIPAFLRDYAQCQDLPESRMKFITCDQITYNNMTDNNQTLSDLKDAAEALGLDSIESFPVFHCEDAYGITMARSKGENQFAVTYSGDTRPCYHLVNSVKKLRSNGFNGKTLLIHEATFSDDLKQEAKARMHSTFSEAVNIGRDMEASEVLLTHFSQRFPKAMDSSAGKEKLKTNFPVGLACDGLSVKLGQVQRLQDVRTEVQSLFIKESEEDQ